MDLEHEKTLDAARIAVQMEIDGKQFYLKAADESSSPFGKKLLNTLAKEEDAHRIRFEKIYNSISTKKIWPEIDFKPDHGQKLRTIFANETETLTTHKKANTSELASVKLAIAMEAKTHDFYIKRSQESIYPAENDFYETVASEEKEHQLILNDYYEYLKNPADWFTTKEHHSMDAG
ncbi:MAG: ferritin family protein [Chloroflexi bacterium]|nr:ferritin family protein [Chloroflexota bacterium]